MTGIPDAGWLFTRGAESVCLVREEDSTRWRLSVFGPGSEVVIREFADVAECMKGQAGIERGLLAEGYQVAQAPLDRRSDHGIWHGSDHRRPAS